MRLMIPDTHTVMSVREERSVFGLIGTEGKTKSWCNPEKM